MTARIDWTDIARTLDPNAAIEVAFGALPGSTGFNLGEQVEVTDDRGNTYTGTVTSTSIVCGSGGRKPDVRIEIRVEVGNA